MYHVPPPTPLLPIDPPPSTPKIGTLPTAIMRSSDKKLIFISYYATDPSFLEWGLVRVCYKDSMAQHPACLHDGRFLVEFYIPYSSDTHHNGINQQCWLQYHSSGNLLTPTSSLLTHMVKPSDTSNAYAKCHNLIAFV